MSSLYYITFMISVHELYKKTYISSAACIYLLENSLLILIMMTDIISKFRLKLILLFIFFISFTYSGLFLRFKK